MPIDDSSQAVKDKVQTVWEATVLFCHRVLRHAQVFGFSLMSIPNPNVQQMHRMLTVGVLPILKILVSDDNLPADDGIKIANMHQYIKHLSDIVSAIDQNDSAAFDAAVAALSKEAMIG